MPGASRPRQPRGAVPDGRPAIAYDPGITDRHAPSVGGGTQDQRTWPGTVDLDPSDWQAAAWAIRTDRTAARAADFGPDARFEFHPVSTSAGPAGVIGVAGPQHGPPLEYDQVIGAVLRHAAIALERIELTDETAAARAEAEHGANSLRDAVVAFARSANPLAAILGAVTSLRQFGDKLPPADQEDLLSAIEDETRRLSRFVANLLDMTKLEAGALEARQDWIDLPDAIRAAVQAGAERASSCGVFAGIR